MEKIYRNNYNFIKNINKSSEWLCVSLNEKPTNWFQLISYLTSAKKDKNEGDDKNRPCLLSDPISFWNKYFLN